MINLFLDIRDFFKSSLGKQIFYYSLFYALTWGVHLLLISVVAFFHLILGHNIGTIADWIVDRGWMEIVMTKIFVFFLAIQFIRLKYLKFDSVRSMIRNSIMLPKKEIFVGVFFFLLSICSIGEVYFNSGLVFSFYRFLTSVIGSILFFSIDLFLIIILDVFYTLESEKDEKIKIYLFPLLFYLFNRVTFIFEQNVTFSLFSYFLLIMNFTYWRRRNWSLPMMFIFFVIVPAFTIIGLDPVWGNSFSLFALKKHISSTSIFIMSLVFVFYLEYIKSRYPEYICQD